MTRPGIAGPLVLSAPDLQAVVDRLGRSISHDHRDGLVLIGLLKGSVCLMADLVRRIEVPCAVDFLALSPYGAGAQRIAIAKDVEIDLRGRPVVVVVDIVDRGLTVSYIRRLLTERGARSVDICTLLDRRVRRLLPVDLRYVGRIIGEEYLVGYGLDLSEQCRNLPGLHLLERPTAPAGAP
jgi:hypoxanthine phosphoribosyltransferase